MTFPAAELSDRIRRLILEQFAPGFNRAIGEDDSLTDIGALDSLRMVEFVLALEPLFGIRVEAADITPENFASIRAIAGYVQRQKPA